MNGYVEAARTIAESAGSHKGAVLAGAATGAALAGTELYAIVTNPHGEASHRANSQSPAHKWFTDHALWLLTVDSHSWASAHVGDVEVNGRTEGIKHHGMTDANAFPAYEIERYERTVEADPERYAGYPRLADKEDLVANLDPSALFTHEEVRALGSFGYSAMEDVLGDEHKPPTEYTLKDAHDVLDTTYARYAYPVEAKRRPKGQPYDNDDIARIVLCDPYSPALEPVTDKIRNGAKGIDKHNMRRFQAPSDLYRRRPELSRPMLDDIESAAPDNKWGPAVLYGGLAIGATLVSVAVERTPLKQAAVKGAVVSVVGGTMALLSTKAGGEKVNAYGHAGKTSIKGLFRMWRNQPVELVPNEDGSYMTTIDEDSLAGKAILKAVSSVTVDELLGQPEHHESPGRRRYTDKQGWRALVNSPLTTTIQATSEKSLFGLRPARGFDMKPGERRPDEPNTAVTDIIQPARVRTLYPDIYEQHYAT